MQGPLLFFWLMAVLSVVTALGVITHRNPVRAALLLIVNFACLAIFYVMLNAQVLAMLQVLVYAGAIMVLFLFVIMLLNLGGETTTRDDLGVWHKVAGAVLGLVLLGGLTYGLDYARTHPQTPGPSALRVTQAEAKGVSQIQIIGWDMFTRYVYPFELTSVLLLVGAMGVIVLTKRQPKTETVDARRS
jgi:NADH-quinone oxidoreductase subunit J